MRGRRISSFSFERKLSVVAQIERRPRANRPHHLPKLGSTGERQLWKSVREDQATILITTFSRIRPTTSAATANDVFDILVR